MRVFPRPDRAAPRRSVDRIPPLADVFGAAADSTAFAGADSLSRPVFFPALSSIVDARSAVAVLVLAAGFDGVLRTTGRRPRGARGVGDLTTAEVGSSTAAGVGSGEGAAAISAGGSSIRAPADVTRVVFLFPDLLVVGVPGSAAGDSAISERSTGAKVPLK